MPHPISLAERKRDYYRTGEQDCDNTFDGDDVPTADDLREAFNASFELDPDDVPHKTALREAWVRGWMETAAYHVARNAKRRRCQDCGDLLASSASDAVCSECADSATQNIQDNDPEGFFLSANGRDCY